MTEAAVADAADRRQLRAGQRRVYVAMAAIAVFALGWLILRIYQTRQSYAFQASQVIARMRTPLRVADEARGSRDKADTRPMFGMYVQRAQQAVIELQQRWGQSRAADSGSYQAILEARRRLDLFVREVDRLRSYLHPNQELPERFWGMELEVSSVMSAQADLEQVLAEAQRRLRAGD